MPDRDNKPKRRSTGRPKAAQAKDCWLTIRVTAEELFRFRATAQRLNQSPGAYGRSCLLHGCAPKTGKTGVSGTDLGDEQNREHLRALLHEARREGVTLNRIAQQYEQDKTPPPAELWELLHKLTIIWDIVLRRLS